MRSRRRPLIRRRWPLSSFAPRRRRWALARISSAQAARTLIPPMRGILMAGDYRRAHAAALPKHWLTLAPARRRGERSGREKGSTTADLTTHRPAREA